MLLFENNATRGSVKVIICQGFSEDFRTNFFFNLKSSFRAGFPREH